VTTSERSLATILFTDIVGSTERATELGDRKWRQLLEEHHARVRRELRRFGGRELNISGDGFLAVFEGPARAIACADALRQAIRGLSLETRCGIHTGEVEGSGKTVGGIGVHIAARVMAEAGPGEILVSHSVRDSVEGSGIGLEDRGPRVLKGVEGERRLYAVTSVPADISHGRPTAGPVRALIRRPLLAGIAAGALVLLGILYATRRDTVADLTPEEAIAADAAPGIAVLPFTVNDPDLATWREGMVDLLSVNLDGVPGLRPITSRTVLARWRDEAPDVVDLDTSLEIARRTGARYALLGSAVAIGGDVRFSADVYDTRSRELLGSAEAQGSRDSVLTLVDRLALGIVRELPQGRDGVIPRIHLEDVTTTSLPALKSYLGGEALFRRGNLDGATAAYERAVSADSTFALALFRLSLVCAWEGLLGRCGGRWAEYDRRAMAYIDRLPPRAATLVRASHDQLGPLRELLRESPDDAETWHTLGDIYEHAPAWALIIDREEEAERAFDRAIELDPGFASYYWHSIEHALSKADSARAFSLIETHGRLAPGSDLDRSYRLAFALGFGDSASRGRALASLDTVETGILIRATGGLLHPSNLPIAMEILRIARDRPDAPWFVFHLQVVDLADLGQFDAAMDVLEDVPDDPAVPPLARKVDVFRLYRLGMDLSSDQLAREFALTKADTTSDGAFAHLAAGVVAADQGRWVDHEAVLARARGEVRRRRAVGDTTAARMFDGVARALQGYALWKRGQPAEAFPQLEAVQRDMRGSAGDFGMAEGNLNAAVRWWLGQILVELDRPRDALVYFRTRVDGGGWATFREFESAKIYEELGEFEKARESYEYALLAWRDADPELRPRIEAAREGLARLPKPLRREAH
jgi:class 3 adenylate cyclase/tetratricopeptide (TPR) repeat protein/TolB-like protein